MESFTIYHMRNFFIYRWGILNHTAEHQINNALFNAHTICLLFAANIITKKRSLFNSLIMAALLKILFWFLVFVWIRCACAWAQFFFCFISFHLNILQKVFSYRLLAERELISWFYWPILKIEFATNQIILEIMGIALRGVVSVLK